MLDMPTIFVLLLLAICLQVVSLALCIFFTYRIDTCTDEIRHARIENSLLRERQDMIYRLLLPTTSMPLSHYMQDTEALNRIDPDKTAKFPAFVPDGVSPTQRGTR